jgi:spectinomycin phosphotransferase
VVSRTYRRAVFSRPDGLPDEVVARELTEGWGLGEVEVRYAPVGFGSHHWQVSRGPHRWFATVDDLLTGHAPDARSTAATRDRLMAALTGARRLRDAGLAFVVAPLPDAAGRLVRVVAEHYALALYPFVDGRTHASESYPHRDARAAVVRRLAELHAVDPSGCAAVLPDDFSLPRLGDLHEAVADLAGRWDAGPYGEPARELLARHRRPLADALERYRTSVASTVRPGVGFVPTHGEPHPGNTIETPDGVVLIDWDTLLLAPPERDLWGLHEEDAGILDLYQALTRRQVDRQLLGQYRLRWDLTEICEYVVQLRHPHEQSQDTAEAWETLQHHLDPSRW